MQRVLITGISGFVGSHLTSFLLGHGGRIFGFDLRSVGVSVECHQGELTDHAKVVTVLKRTLPDIVYHLAGVIKSDDPAVLYKTNLMGTVSLFEAVMEIGLRPKMVVASSSAIYGRGANGGLIDEKTELHPVTHYAVSKVAQEMAALRYFNSYKLPVMVVRMFNLLGPGQSVDLACSSFARQIALAELHGGSEIFTGNLNARRDFLDVRDAARAFVMLAEKGNPGEVYNACSGKAVAIQKCLDTMLSMSSRPLKVRIAADRVQQDDVSIQVGSAEKISSATGWHPQIPLEQSLADLLNDWRQRVKLEAE